MSTIHPPVRPAPGGPDCLPPSPFEVPLLGRHSALQLTCRPGTLGFSNLLWAGETWQGLGSPFLRVADVPLQAVECEPEAIRLRGEGVTLTALFVGPDEVAVELVADRPVTVHSGAPGRLHAVAGTQEQDWFAFDALREGSRLALLDETSVHLHHAPGEAVCAVAGAQLSAAGNGWSFAAPAGRTCLGLALAWEDPAAARDRAAAVRARLREAGGSDRLLAARRAEWVRLFAALPLPAGLDESLVPYARHAAFCLLTNVSAPLGRLRRPPLYAAKTQYPSVYPWDSAFAAVALRELAPATALDQIRLYAGAMKEDGRVGVFGYRKDVGSVQYPLFAWALRRITEHTGETGPVRELYPALCRHAEWWLTDEKVARARVPLYRETMCLDDSPRFFPFAAEGRMALREPVCAPDLLFFCARDRHHLAWLAERLGRDAEAATHRQEAARLAALCDAELYDPARQRYVDRGESGRASPVDSPFNHFPAALSPRPAVRSRAAAALGRTGPFWGRYGVTSIATDEACFDPYRGFRGAIWFAVNYLCAASCRLLGDAATAEAIVAASGELIRAEPGMAKGFRENYHYLSGAGTGAHHFPTLSAAPFLSLLLGHDRGESAPRAD